MHVPASAAPTSLDLRDVMRLTDSVHVYDDLGGYHLAAVVDETDLSRAGLERRIRGRLGPDVAFGWAAFPSDGLTLGVLLEVAGADLATHRVAEPAGSAAPAAAHAPAGTVGAAR
jgi:hypothetical protein